MKTEEKQRREYSVFYKIYEGGTRYMEEEFTKMVQEMMILEERQRIRIAQGLPFTTDEPESTIPTELKLHTQVRAIERAEFDHQLAEEEEVRRLRKELVPKAQLMPYSDRLFIPRRPRINKPW